MVRVPVLTPRLSSLWLGLVTPIYARVGRKLIESMRNPTLVFDRSALTTFGIKPKGLRESIERALHHENREFALTFWSDALSSGGKTQSWGGVRFGTRLVDSRTIQVSVPPALAFAPIQRIGGSNGWYFATFLFVLSLLLIVSRSRGAVIRQTAIFDPAGLAGLFYWYALYPIHYCIFNGMLHEIAAIAERGPGAASLPTLDKSPKITVR